MLNISHNKLNRKVTLTDYKAGKMVFHRKHFKYFNRFLKIFAVMAVVIMFLPWTQNIKGKGYLTTLMPDQRPQTIQSPIPGKIEKWFVKEGDFVSKGDTILFISEVKNEYFDPQLVERTGQQITAKELAVDSYKEKVKALDAQVAALARERTLKLEQARNKLVQAKLKVRSDSIDLEAARTNLKIAETQFDRTLALQQEGLKAMTDVEAKRLKLQETQAKMISQENKFLTSKNEVINSSFEISRLNASFAEKISKASSDKFTARSNQFNAEGQVTKLENSRTNYEIRNQLYYIKAPQSGYINKALRGGLGETFKEGEKLVSIMPSDIDLAVETYIDPIDLPLIKKGEEVRIQFDGWPAVVFSGWPNVSYGTYGGKVVAIENYISENGKYRLLIAPDSSDHAWPKDLRVGSGANTLALLNDVPIWFEIWRKLNGFPPNYYQTDSSENMSKREK